MARTVLTVNEITRAGLAPAAETAADAVNGNSVGNDGNMFLLVHNTDAASQTLSIQFAKTVDGQAVTARTVTVAAAASAYVGPFPVADYGSNLGLNASSANLQLTAYRISR